MTRSSDVHNWNDLIAGYALGNLTLAETKALQQLLKTDPKLTEELTIHEDLANLLPLTLQGTTPAPRLKKSIMQAAIESANTAQHVNPSIVADIPKVQPSHKRKIGWQWMVAGLGACAIIGLGWQNLSLRQQVGAYASLEQQLAQAEQDLQRLRTRLDSSDAVVASLRQPNVMTFSMTGAESSTASSGVLLAIPGRSNLVLVSHELPELTESQIYRFWAVTEDASTPVYCGQFRHDNTGTARWQSPNVVCSQDPVQVMVTLDAPEDPISTAGPVILEGEV
ncbi:MAG: anti-sigma factor [Cyanobacteria bacterium P01_F01_bin.3]